MSEPLPDIATCEWPVDWRCYGTEDEVAAIDPDLKALAESLATSSLHALTLGQVGGCPITVRPVSLGCVRHYGFDFLDGAWMIPYIRDGAWVNACGCASFCSHTTRKELLLPAPVGPVTAVQDGATLLDPSAYRVDDNRVLVRLDGEVWPLWQDMTASVGDPGTLAITYLNGTAPDGMAAYVAGLLAQEFLKACSGQECALPRNVVAFTRQGVSVELSTGVFPNNRTGIDAVDAWLFRFNPYAIVTPSVIYSPDSPQAHRTTWSA